MASNTPNLKLYKVNTKTDGNNTFNIDTMLNDNWDKIDGTMEIVNSQITELGLKTVIERTRKITFGTTVPSGGENGDIYFQYE